MLLTVVCAFAQNDVLNPEWKFEIVKASEINTDAEYAVLTGVNIPEHLFEQKERTFITPQYASINGKNVPVKQIGEKAFKGLTQITYIELSDGLELIADEAFSGCNSLKSIVLPPSILEVGKDAFKGCPISCINIQNENNIPLNITQAIDPAVVDDIIFAVPENMGQSYLEGFKDLMGDVALIKLESGYDTTGKIELFATYVYEQFDGQLIGPKHDFNEYAFAWSNCQCFVVKKNSSLRLAWYNGKMDTQFYPFIKTESEHWSKWPSFNGVEIGESQVGGDPLYPNTDRSAMPGLHFINVSPENDCNYFRIITQDASSSVTSVAVDSNDYRIYDLNGTLISTDAGVLQSLPHGVYIEVKGRDLHKIVK